jgi:prophage antirepressor-like protein
MELVRHYNSMPVRIIRRPEITLFSAYDIATCLELEDKRREVNKAVINADTSYVDYLGWGNDWIIFVNEPVIRQLVFRADWEVAKQFIKWLVEINYEQLTLF